jgi:hypothetical protein
MSFGVGMWRGVMLRSFSMSFDGHLLERGFWLYVWEIKGPLSHHVYVGRTGDTSSPNAQSPFKRIGQHLGPSPNAKGNSLGKLLREAGVTHSGCTFEMVAIGPIFPEQATFQAHVPFRDQTAALERAVADLLRNRGYHVLGTHPRGGEPDGQFLQQITAILDQKFPAFDGPNHHGLESAKPDLQVAFKKPGGSTAEP